MYFKNHIAKIITLLFLKIYYMKNLIYFFCFLTYIHLRYIYIYIYIYMMKIYPDIKSVIKEKQKFCLVTHIHIYITK